MFIEVMVGGGKHLINVNSIVSIYEVTDECRIVLSNYKDGGYLPVDETYEEVTRLIHDSR